MLTPAVLPFKVDALFIAPEVSPEAVTLKLQGSCDAPVLPAFDRFLDQLHQELLRTGVKRVTVDCDRLYFMNSASVKCFVVWLTKIKALPKPSHYGVRFITNPRLAWQWRSFSTIRRSAPELVTLSNEGQSA